MPELPEVETTRRGIAPHIQGQIIKQVIVRDVRLRWPVPAELDKILRGQCINIVTRRAKYLLLGFNKGSVILHLGMSGSLRVLPARTPPEKHDHIDFVFKNGLCLRLRDPRRFGSIHWMSGDPLTHKLLNKLGPEPLSDDFTGEVLFARSRKRCTAVKTFIMNNQIVVGVGNIYASEALHAAGIDPRREAGTISKARYLRLAGCIKQVIAAAIKAGGTTLRDFTQSDGKPGYFAQQLQVYGREGEACFSCGKAIMQATLGQRASFFCSRCQR
jgi:formamidopyrimidine-DNA glycosylase